MCQGMPGHFTSRDPSSSPIQIGFHRAAKPSALTPPHQVLAGALLEERARSALVGTGRAASQDPQCPVPLPALALLYLLRDVSFGPSSTPPSKTACNQLCRQPPSNLPGNLLGPGPLNCSFFQTSLAAANASLCTCSSC